MIRYISDHFAQARARLTSKMLSYPQVEAALEVLTSEYQAVEDMLFDLSLVLSPFGHGVWLDRVGQWLDEPREGLPDELYSKVLRYSWMSRNETSDDYTHGSQEHIVALVKGMTGAIKVSYVQNPPRGFWITYVVPAPLDSTYKQRIRTFVERATPAGHTFLVAEAVLPYANPLDPDGSSYNNAPIAEAIL